MAKSPSLGRVQKVTIENIEIPVVYEELRLENVRLDAENPRIREELRQRRKTGPVTQEELGEVILQISGVPELQRAIRENKGLHEPIYVQADGTVVEGNCRAAIFKFLRSAQRGETRWNTIPALKLPSTVTPRQIAILRGSFHVVGKNKWRAYAQAEELHRMKTELKMRPEQIATALGLREKEVTLSLQTYETMSKEVLPRITNGDGRDKYSYLHEFYKRKNLENFRKTPGAAKLVAELVVTNKLKQGVQVRDLDKIVGNPHALKLLKQDGFNSAIAYVGKSDPTADSRIFRKLKSTARMLNNVKRPDIDRIRRGTVEKAIFQELFDALKTVAETAGLQLK